MKPTPLLDFWEPPEGAGQPVAALATTFVLEPDFFERDCLARFLSLQSIDEESGSASDTLAKIELEEKLREPAVTVLADRSTRADRTSLRWDLLHCHVPGGALLHAKVAVLMWEHSTRVLVGSANLTSAGYRRQIELGMTGDLGAECLLPAPVLNELARELESYLALIPGQGPDVPAVRQVRTTLKLFSERVSAMPKPARSRLRVALAPTSPKSAPLDRRNEVWEGTQPLRATHLSPFWDSSDATVLQRVRRDLTGRGKRGQIIATVVTPQGTVPITTTLRDAVDDVVALGAIDDETARALHAKCLLIESDQWVAAMVGSSNHTKAGLGLTGSRHRELNVWLAAPAGSAEGKALAALIRCGTRIPVGTPVSDLELDEDEPTAIPLPLGFTLCRLHRDEATGKWQLTLSFDPTGLPASWTVGTTSDAWLLDSAIWRANGSRDQVTCDLPGRELPTYVEVTWPEGSATWTVLADSRHDLPPGPGVSDLKAHQLFAALTAGKSITAAMAEELERRQVPGSPAGPVLDPLKRFDDRSSLLRRGRALSAALVQLQRRLGRPVFTVDTLSARLASPLGPAFLATKVCEEVASGQQEQPEGLFTLAEISLAVGRVDWDVTLEQVDRLPALALVSATLDTLDALRADLGDDPPAIAAYAVRSMEEARRCLQH